MLGGGGGRESISGWEREVMAGWGRPSVKRRGQEAARDTFLAIAFPKAIDSSSNYES